MNFLAATFLVLSLHLSNVPYSEPRPQYFDGGNALSSKFATEQIPKGNEWENSGHFEGDIILNPLLQNGRLCIGLFCRWPDKTVPYVIDSKHFGLFEMMDILYAFDEYHKKTCIKFRPATADDFDYINITDISSGCSSYVGRQGGAQIVQLKIPGCLKHGTIVHELLHVLGFYHQQSSTDRDKYVKILWNNIQKGKENNFAKYSESQVTSYGIKYDYNSVMHYSSYAFSKNGEETIIPLEPEVFIGQRYGLSEKDIKKLHLMYECEASSNSSEERI